LAYKGKLDAGMQAMESPMQGALHFSDNSFEVRVTKIKNTHKAPPKNMPFLLRASSADLSRILELELLLESCFLKLDMLCRHSPCSDVRQIIMLATQSVFFLRICHQLTVFLGPEPLALSGKSSSDRRLLLRFVRWLGTTGSPLSACKR
jgi:hypothetical protein